MTGQFVQYGCGLCAPAGWINFDASPTLRLQRTPLVGALLTRRRIRFPPNVRYGDVVKGLPLPSGSCRAAYCSHILEHLSLCEFQKALRETHRILEAGGFFRGALPDLEALAKTYLSDSRAEAAVTFMEASLLGVHERPRGLTRRIGAMLGNSQHLWMWDYKALAAELQTAGFREIRRAMFGDSQVAEFSAVEERTRWDGCLGFECRR